MSLRRRCGYLRGRGAVLATRRKHWCWDVPRNCLDDCIDERARQPAIQRPFMPRAPRD